MHATHYVGKAGEFAVASQLLLRGVSVHFPAVDDGVDLIAGGRVRIQVKSARRTTHPRNKSTLYHFNIATSAWKASERRMKKLVRDWNKVVDFFVFWGIDEDRFWIVPASLVAGMVHLQLGTPQDHAFTVDRDAVRALLGTGLNQREVARRLEISEMSVSRVVNNILPTTRPEGCYRVAEYENAWHEIIAAVGLVSTVDGLAPLKTNQEVSI